jgi:hypothetical protein
MEMEKRLSRKERTALKIAAAKERSAIDCTICAKCSADLGETGSVIETATFKFAVCAECLESIPPDKILEILDRAKLFQNLRWWTDERGESRMPQAIFVALNLGFEIYTLGKERILWAFSGHTPGWSGDGDSAPSWYRSNDRSWTDLIVQTKTGKIREKDTDMIKWPIKIIDFIGLTTAQRKAIQNGA